MAVGEAPSLSAKGKVWQAQMFYNLVSDYSIIYIQLMRFLNMIACGCPNHWFLRKYFKRRFILEQNLKTKWYERAWKFLQRNLCDEKIQDDIQALISENDNEKNEN